ncbi:putative phosphatidate phosphatase [Rhipicephalus microplus]|uniref:putative phosphatidate phosphatase n=1 Tax=Rhipicephalus microplus TaxID=6941 RepID=UPI003F6ABE4B
MPSVYVKVFIHVFSLSILFGSLALFYFVGKPFKRGFFCHDPALSYPFRKSTVTSVMLYTLCSLTAIKTIVFTELALMFFESHKFKLFLVRCYGALVTFVNGVFVSQLITDVAKYSVGRLRPHFFRLCKPVNYDLYCPPNATANTYIENYECSPGTDPYLLKNVHMSFMSGQSSFAAFCASFSVIYIIANTTPKTRYLLPLKSIFAAAITCSAMYISYSRITDYKHHWEDVTAGYMQGSVLAYLIWFYNNKMIHSDKK